MSCGDLTSSFRSNQTVGWERIVIALGDRLLQLGHVHAAHVCYLVSFTPFGYSQSSKRSAANAKARLILLGVDANSSNISLHSQLRTPESIEAFYRTEAFEWARRRGGNRKTHIPILQPYKLRYAQLLADFGWEESAREYVLSVRSCIGFDSTSKGAPHKSGSSMASGNLSSGTSLALLQDEAFIESLKQLDDRICVSTGAEPLCWNVGGEDGNKGGVARAMGSIVKSVLGKKTTTLVESKPDECEMPSSENEADEGPTAEDPQKQKPNELVQEKPQDDTAHSDLEVISSMVNKPNNFMQVPTVAAHAGGSASTPKAESGQPLLSNPFIHNDNVATRGLLASDVDDKKDTIIPSSAPPTLGVDLDDEPLPPSKSENKENEKTSVLSTPVTKKPEESRKQAPTSEPPSELLMKYYPDKLFHLGIILQLFSLVLTCRERGLAVKATWTW